MSRLIKFSEAVRRLSNFETSALSIEDALQDAVDTIFELGRYPGTVKEVEITEALYETGANDEVFIFLDPLVYDGVIRFRNGTGGFGLQDLTSLYIEKLNAGDNCFIDYGLVDKTVNQEAVKRRKYRCPLGFVYNASDPIYALMKCQSPVMESDDYIPIPSFMALKAAVMAVGCEAIGDDERAVFYWQQFDSRMIRSQKQFEGAKEFSIGMNSTLKRKPKQFM